MLYLNISDLHLEVLKVDKIITGGEKIVASSRREMPEGVISDGLIKDEEKFRVEFQKLLSSAYPKPIKGDKAALSISDHQSFTERLKLSPEVKEDEIVSEIVSNVKRTLHHDPARLENFYKEIEKTSPKEMFYTATQKSTIAHFVRHFQKLGIKVEFLSSRSLSIFELVSSLIAASETILYVQIEEGHLFSVFMDRYSPIWAKEVRIEDKPVIDEIESVLSTARKDKEIEVEKVITGGRNSIRMDVEKFRKKTGLELVKIKDVIEDLIKKKGLDFDSGGVPQFLFAQVLGLILLRNTAQPPNFAVDADELVDDTESVVTEEEIKPKSDEKESFDRDSQILSDQIVEYKKPVLKQIISSKIFIVLLTALVVFGTTSGLLFFIGKKDLVTLPFVGGPTLTPTPTVQPTSTPTPTIDPDLDRTEINLSVQNGTDISGLAGRTGDFLEKAGYEDVDRTNADRDDYEKTIVRIKESKRNFLQLFLRDIEERVEITEVEELDEEEEYDLVLVLGQDVNDQDESE